MCIERLPPSSVAGGSSANLINAENPDVADAVADDSDSDTDFLTGYDSSVDESSDVFKEYMWMEHEHEFEQEVIKKLEEEELTIQCLIAMSQLSILDEIIQLEDEQYKESVLTDIAQKSSLNPFAAEFFPADAIFMINI